MQEHFKPVNGYEGRYSVSNLGRVYSHRQGGRLLNPSIGTNPYPRVTLHSPRSVEKVHHLVAAAFLGPRPHGLSVCHRDGNRLNNAACNLYYGTAKQNSADAISHGTWTKGQKCHSAKLTPAQVLEMRRLRSSGLTYKQLGQMFGVAMTNAREAVLGINWRHV